MTATDILRQLLDERGVKWEEPDPYQDATAWVGSNNIEYVAHEGISFDGPTGRLILFCLTPEQAVDATLGRGTCRKVRAWEDDPRGGGGWVLVCSECDELLANDGEDGEFDGPNYCPNCGRKVEP